MWWLQNSFGHKWFILDLIEWTFKRALKNYGSLYLACNDKRDDFDFDIVNFPLLDGDVRRRASYGVYISQLIRFARVCNHVTDFNARNKYLTVKLLQQGYRYHKLRKTFSKFYRRHYELIFKYNVGLKTLLSEGLSEPEFYVDLVYKKETYRKEGFFFSAQKNHYTLQTYWL